MGRPRAKRLIAMCMSPLEAWSIKGKVSFKKRNTNPDMLLPCGKCAECLAARRNDWCNRLQLEQFLHDSSVFVTLTYDNEHLPSDKKVNKKDVQKFLKRFRQIPRDYHLAVNDFRYFIVSEYGEKFGRPHYHGILFGVDCFTPDWKYRLATIRCDLRPLYTSDVLQEVWSLGFVSVDKVTPSSIAYVTKYITKSSADGFRLFSRGLGKGYFYDKDNALLPRGEAAILNNYVVMRSGRNGFRKAPIPKNIDRYIGLYDASMHDVIKALRRDFMRCKCMDTRTLSERAAIQNIHNREETQKRKLDNGS